MTSDGISTNNPLDESFGGDPLLDGLEQDPLSVGQPESGSSEPESSLNQTGAIGGESNENLNPYLTANSWDEAESSSSSGIDVGEEGLTTDSDLDPVTQEPISEEGSGLTGDLEPDPLINPGMESEAETDVGDEFSGSSENNDGNIDLGEDEESEEKTNSSAVVSENDLDSNESEIDSDVEENSDTVESESKVINEGDSDLEDDESPENSTESSVNEEGNDLSSDSEEPPTEMGGTSNNPVSSDSETDEVTASDETVSEQPGEDESESDPEPEAIAENPQDTLEPDSDPSSESDVDNSVASDDNEAGTIEDNADSSNGNEGSEAELTDPLEENSGEEGSDSSNEETEAELSDPTEDRSGEDAATDETGESESDPVVDGDTGESPINFDVGTFTVGESGEVGIDFLFDGGRYQGQVAIVSLSGMEEYEPGSVEFIQEAARRALSESELGHIAIDDLSQGAKFEGSLGERQWNQGDYQGVKTFAMRPGDKFFLMMVPNGAIERVANDPAIGGASRPLFSLATANPDDEYHVGQIADITGDGSAFAWEDLRVDAGTDRDYNDIIFQVRGAKGVAAHMNDVVDPQKDWRTSELGHKLVDYITSQLPDDPVAEQPEDPIDEQPEDPDDPVAEQPEDPIDEQPEDPDDPVVDEDDTDPVVDEDDTADEDDTDPVVDEDDTADEDDTDPVVDEDNTADEDDTDPVVDEDDTDPVVDEDDSDLDDVVIEDPILDEENTDDEYVPDVPLTIDDPVITEEEIEEEFVDIWIAEDTQIDDSEDDSHISDVVSEDEVINVWDIKREIDPAWEELGLVGNPGSYFLNQEPVVTAYNQTVNAGASISPSFYVSDPDGDLITHYYFYDDNKSSTSGYFTFNGVKQTNLFSVTPDQLSNVRFVGGSVADTDEIYIGAYDGQDWGLQFAIITTQKVNQAPVVTAYNQTVNSGSNTSLSFSVSDPDGD
ncbi:DUF4114 domain-containing protein, partial [Oxynema sp. CENA135]|uniref:DUF4114 domain-containing protein n=1 Tax=Oxynema sp. CENA135 TaxID=984206 RepID=UPI00190E398C